MAAFAAATAAMTTLAVTPAHAAAGFTVSGSQILDANGNAFVMRGVNHAHTWYPDKLSSLADIKALGANTVRVVLSSGDRWTRNDASDVTGVIDRCKANRLICVLEVHDTTGYGEDSAATTLDRAVDYWISIRSALAGQERYVILDIGNEPYGNTATAGWITDTENAITRLRAAGFEHSIMVDAPNWGQDWSFTMRDNAASVFATDPRRNTIFSIHMYGVFDTAAEITDYLGRFRAAGLPIVIGEFGYNHSDGDPDEDTIMATAQAQGIGYLGWSWSGNGGGVEYLDLITDFDATRLTPWGERLFHGPDGIRATSREATVYGTPPSSPPGRTCTATYAITGQWTGGFQGAVTVQAGTAPISAWTVAWTWPDGQRFTNSWNAAVTTSGGSVTARSLSYNASLPAGGSTSWGFTAAWTGANTAPAPTCTAS
ncbi:cellulase family glycosylhydrolase [Actinoplanes sp. NPDC049681]|uniref:cellulase family glycosylhydrolase n=1 Tax=Actinoplanes sp. NPDC049681 TaxID=3363905 RepID=UPI0037935D82